MKKNKRKFLLSLCTLLALGGLCLSAGCKSCNGDNPQSEDETEQSEIVIDKTSAEILIGEELFLDVDYEPITGYTLAFASANPEIASVSADGKVVGISEGTTKITVSYGQKSQTCEITVGLGGQTPRLFFAQGFEEEVSVLLGSELDMSAYVLFNRVRHDDVTLTYTVDSAYGSVTGNTFKSIKSGETEIGVTASWRGVECADFTRTVKVTIQKDFEVYVNDGSLGAFTLYASNITGEATQMPFTPFVTKDGEQKSGVVVTVADESVARYDNGVLSAVSVGETMVNVSQAELGVSKNFPLTVLRPIVAHTGEAIDFSAQDGDLDYTSKLAGETLVSAEQNGVALTVIDGKIMGVTPNIIKEGDDRKIGTTKIILYTPTVGYEYELKAYTKIIKTAQDLSVLDISASNVYATCAYDETEEKKIIKCEVDGYFALGNDIAYDETWKGNANTAVTGSNATTCRFAGTFDGRGYTLTTNVGKGGLFGNLSGKALIKNVRIEIEEMTSNVGFAINGTGNSATQATCFDNVHITVNLDKSEHATPFALFQNCQGFLTLRNTVIDVQYPQELTANRTYGVLWQATTNHTKHVFENSYIITSDNTTPMIRYYNVKTNEEGVKYVSADYEVYAENEGRAETSMSVSAEQDKNGLAHTKTIKVLSGLRRYTSLEAMQKDKANCKLNGFEEAYWDIRAGLPLWKTAIRAEECRVVAGNSVVGTNVNIPIINDSIEFAVICNGVNLNPLTGITVKLYGANEAGIVDIDGTSIIGLNEGVVTVRISYKINDTTYNKDVTVMVGKSITTKTDVVEYFSASDGVFDRSLLGNVSANSVIGAAQLVNGEEVPLTVSVGSNGELILTGVTPNVIVHDATTYTSTVSKYTGTTAPESATSYSKDISDRTLAPTQITIYTNQKTYIFTNVMAYTKVLDEASDWDIFKTATDGYYILTEDIDFGGAEFTAENVNFAGVIDGNGKTVKNFSTNGLVYALTGAIVKDVAFVGTITGRGLFGQNVNGWTRFSNVYMSLTLDAGYAFANNIKESVFADVIVEIENGAEKAEERTKGLFATAVSGGKCERLLFNNVKVVTKDNAQTGITIDDDLLATFSTTDYCYASNDTELLNEGEVKNWVYAGITRYTDNLTAGSVGNWTVAQDGSITWTEA